MLDDQINLNPMKKSTILFVCFLLVSFLAKAQVGDLKSRKYFKLGLSVPAKDYFGRADINFDYKRKSGISLEGGRIFMLNGIKLKDGFKFGLDATYIGIYYHYLNPDIYLPNHSIYENFSNIFPVNEKEGSIFLYSKFGPSFSYSPVKNLVFDLFFKANLNWIGLSYLADEEFSANNTEMYGGYLGLGYSTGINFRYQLLLVSFEINSVKMKMESADYAGEYLGNPGDLSTNKTPMPYFNITLGMSY
jgi:hypothetical protein